jgi:hypothetical protein
MVTIPIRRVVWIESISYLPAVRMGADEIRCLMAAFGKKRTKLGRAERGLRIGRLRDQGECLTLE